jgi:chorismate synthase
MAFIGYNPAHIMRGNSFGKLFSLTSFGESHGPCIGVVLDGVPSGLPFSLEELKAELLKRAPGKVPGTSDRNEDDVPEVLSGIFEGVTSGAPIAVIVKNKDQKSSDYDVLKNNPRRGHADITYELKYKIRDHRGGGRSSGRETIARVIAGYFAGLVLKKTIVRAFVKQMGPYKNDSLPKELNFDHRPYGFIDTSKNEEIKNYLEELKVKGDSIGGVVGIIVDHCPLGLGEPAFDKLKADLAKALLSIGACVSFSYGLAAELVNSPGSVWDSEELSYGGILGGISNGERMIMSIQFKPTSTIGENAKNGRHDPCIIPRALYVAEAMVKIVLCDHYLRQKAYDI